MSIRTRTAIAAGVLALVASLPAAASHQPLSADQARALLKSLTFRHGDVVVGPSHARLHLDSDFSYLDAADAQKVLHQLWDNPPDSNVLGMIVPGNGPEALVNDSEYAVVVTYTGDGYVSDKDAADLDYGDLLKRMQTSIADHNPQRIKDGYTPITLKGWAEPPHYDHASHKLYWAKDIAFKGQSEDTLNYDIRVLGRYGYLSLNAVAGMDQLASVRQGMQSVLPMVRFDKGSRYTDFNRNTDRIAAYGIGALIAGTLAAKAGLFAKLLALLLAAKKLIIAGLAAVAAFARKLFRRKKA